MNAEQLLDVLRQAEELISSGRVYHANLLIQQTIAKGATA